MKKEELEQLKRDIDIKLATEISKSTVKEMAKQENAKSQIKTFRIICIVFAITMLICIISTCFTNIQLMRLIENTVIVEEVTKEDINMDAQTGDGSGSAINFYSNGNDNNINNNEN